MNKKQLTMALTGATLLACSLGGQAQTQTGAASTTKAGAAGTGAVTVSGNDSHFLNEAAMGGMAEVALGRLAIKQGSTDQVKKLGQHMVDDHTKANDELMRIVSQKGTTAPSDLDAKHKAVLNKLTGLSGEKFDKAYLHSQQEDHAKMINLFTREAKHGDDADIKAFAAKTLPTLQEHATLVKNTRP